MFSGVDPESSNARKPASSGMKSFQYCNNPNQFLFSVLCTLDFNQGSTRFVSNSLKSRSKEYSTGHMFATFSTTSEEQNRIKCISGI